MGYYFFDVLPRANVRCHLRQLLELLDIARQEVAMAFHSIRRLQINKKVLQVAMQIVHHR
jgi:hypothetical protein